MQALLARPRLISGLYAGGGKRLLDLALVILFALLWLPLIGVAWLISWLEAGQGFYSDLRVGQNGVPFRCWKIRTMCRSTLRACAVRKWRFNPRITTFGRLLRRSSLDELPQLICVLKGEMSLVGPRPIPASEVPLYGLNQRQYLNQRPGLTGLWQVSGRNALPYSTRVSLDVEYAKQPTLVGDIVILLLTYREVWRMSGR